MKRHRLTAFTAAAAAATLALMGSSSATGAAGGGSDDDVEPQLAAGVQIAPKHTTRPSAAVNGTKVAAVNPYVGLVRDPAKVDWAYWRHVMAAKAAQRYADEPSVPFVWDEQEPAGTLGSNDTPATAEEINAFGTAPGKRNAVRILGRLFVPPPIPTPRVTTTENQGAIPLATNTGIPALRSGARIVSEIGDGPHGSNRSGNGDFDFMRLRAEAGDAIAVSTAGSDFDTMVAVYDASGEMLALDDDGGAGLSSLLSYDVQSSGRYFVLVTGFFALPEDPFDSSSGTGAESEGEYVARIMLGPSDTDHYAVRLHSGDVIGGVIQGGSPDVTVTQPDGVQAVGSTQDLSFLYPAQSRLPGGGNATFGYVAEQPGWYTVSTAAGTGRYDILLEAYRPGSETRNRGTVQTVFLDFDGERVNTAVWGGPGVRTLSPFSSFVAKWGLTNADRHALITGIVNEVRENLRIDLEARGLNDDFTVRILNSRDNPDAFGRPDVSRVIIGGTIGQSGIDTIGIASSIDPGNFAGEDQALVLLDVLSGDPEDFGEASLNDYFDNSSDRVAFVSQAVGNVTSHEIGHYVGSFHVDQFNDVLNLMDQGGNFPLLYGAGPDGIGGTADDWDVDFGEDEYNPNEGFTGIEDTLNNSAWAFSVG